MFGTGSTPTVKAISAPELQRLLQDGAVTLVDVREIGEWQSGHIPGAVHKPLSRLRDLLASIPPGKPVVFQCLSGGRSAQAVALCRSLGLPHDTHLAGGLSTWKAHGLPVAA